MENDVFNGFGVLVTLPSPGSFLSIKETLTRIGVSSKSNNKLYQSCHILHKKGQYALMHFKEMLALDGKQDTLTENDIGRRNAISGLLQEWGLLMIVYPEEIVHPTVSINQIKILTFKEKANYELIQKYHFGANNV